MTAVRADAGPLGNITRTAGVQDRRRVRLEARDLLRSVTDLPRVARCASRSVRSEGVSLRATVSPAGTTAGLAGLDVCGSVWACPCCSVKIRSQRSTEVASAVESWLGQDERHKVGMLTLTMRHSRRQGLGNLWDGLSAAWRHFGSSWAWKDTFRRHHVGHSLRVTEVTHGRHGWHVHLHVLLFLRDDITPDLDIHKTHLFAQWSESLAVNGFSAWARVQDLRVFAGAAEAVGEIGDYLNKSHFDEAARVAVPTESLARSAALESTRSDLKAGKGGNRTPFAVLVDALAGLKAGGGELTSEVSRDLAIWHEYERGSKGRRALVWSRGARLALGLGVELTDEEAAEVELGTREDDLLFLSNGAVSRLTRNGSLLADLLDAVEGGSSWVECWEIASDFCRRHGLVTHEGPHLAGVAAA